MEVRDYAEIWLVRLGQPVELQKKSPFRLSTPRISLKAVAHFDRNRIKTAPEPPRKDTPLPRRIHFFD
ncbi:MAG: hypothetical protein RLY14_1834 [Planctomycetota bacterium]|jgi:hypothetical protein